MSITAQIERELTRNPAVRNADLAARYGCSNSLASRVRKRLGLPYYPNQRKQLRIVLPAHMLKPLIEIASQTGDDVTIDDLVVATLNDLIAEHRSSEAAE